MDISKWLSALLQLLILIPAAVSFYLPAVNQMKYPPAKTAFLCLPVLLLFTPAAAFLHAVLLIRTNILLLLFLVPFFFLYRRTVNLDMPRCLAIYIGVCAIETFPMQLGYAFDSALHPASGAADLSFEAALFRLGLSCLLLAAFIRPAVRYFSWAVDSLDFPKIWYSAVALSVIFLVFNVLAVPQKYATLHAGRMHWLFPVFELFALAVLTAVYALFYQNASVILKHTKLKERSRLLEMQSHQYHKLQEHIQKTAKLRHDFRHSIRLLASLAQKGDICSIQAHLKEYEAGFPNNSMADYCKNAALNALFGYYHEMAVSAGIRTDWNIELPEPLVFSETDMAALFGNLMENAIAGCQTLPQASRYFCLTAEIQHTDSLYIVSTNSFNGITRKRKERYLSTRHKGTGLGLASIAAVAEKYGGSAKISNSDTEFFADILLKIHKA